MFLNLRASTNVKTMIPIATNARIIMIINALHAREKRSLCGFYENEEDRRNIF